MAYEGNRYAGLNRKGPQDKAGWLGAAGTVAGAGLGLLAGPGGMAAGAKLGGALGGVTHDAVNGTLTPMSVAGDVMQGVSGFNGLNGAMDNKSILEAFMRDPHSFRVPAFANGGLVTGQGMDMASQWAQMDPVQRAMLQAQQAVGPAPTAPTPQPLQQAQHPTLEALSSLLPQIMAAMPRPANPRNTKAIGAWAPAIGLAASVPAAVAQSRRASANAPIEAANTTARSDYEAKRKAYEERKTKISDTLVGNATKRFGGTSQSAMDEPMDEETAMLVTGDMKWAGHTRKQWADYLAGVRAKKVPVGAQPKPAGPTLDEGGLELAARQYADTGVMPPLGMGNGGLRTQIINRAGAIMGERGGSIAGSQSSYRANSASMTQLQKMVDAVTSFEKTALANSNVLMSAMKKIPDSGSPFLNQPIRSLAGRAGGSAEIAAYNTALRVVVPEFAKLLANPNLTGVLSDEARREMSSAISGDATISQMVSVLAVLQQDAKNRHDSYTQQLDEIRGRIQGQKAPGFKMPASSLRDTLNAGGR